MSYSSNSEVSKRGSVLSFLLTVILTVIGFVYISLTAYTNDALWFYPTFDAQPVRGVLNCYGEEVAISSDNEHLAMIAELVNGQISGDKRWNELNLAVQAYEEYKSSPRMMVLELYYEEPQRIHSPSPFFSNFDSLIIPLDGRYASENILFNLIRGKPAGGSFHIQSFEPVREYIEDKGLCQGP